MIAAPEHSRGEYWTVHDANGRLVAQGSQFMCERIAAGREPFGKQGGLFGAAP